MFLCIGIFATTVYASDVKDSTSIKIHILTTKIKSINDKVYYMEGRKVRSNPVIIDSLYKELKKLYNEKDSLVTLQKKRPSK